MKIQKITPFLVDRFLLVRVYTDQGLVGNGEAGLWAHHGMVYRALLDLNDYFIGKDASRIEHHYQTVSRDTHFTGSVLSAALSAIDVALWDIAGQAVGQPVHQLLGGRVRDKIKVNGSVNGDSVDECAAVAQKQVAAGFISLRLTPFLPVFERKTASQVIGEAVALVAAVRAAVGYNIDLGLEIHRNLRPEEAIVLARELLPFRILYYEDPLAPQSLEAMEYVAATLPLPIATGERFYNIFQFKDLIDRKIVSLIRPDLSLAGGFTQVKKIAAIAESAFVGVFPHLMGSPVNIAAYCQLNAAIPNYVLMESNPAADAFNDIVDYPVQRQGSYLVVPDRPGIGLEIDESKLERFPYQPKRILGNFHADGSVAH